MELLEGRSVGNAVLGNVGVVAIQLPITRVLLLLLLLLLKKMLLHLLTQLLVLVLVVLLLHVLRLVLLLEVLLSKSKEVHGVLSTELVSLLSVPLTLTLILLHLLSQSRAKGVLGEKSHGVAKGLIICNHGLSRSSSQS